MCYNHCTILGWGTQLCSFIFLRRNWEEDKEYLADSLALFREAKYPVHLLVFPEGTDLSEQNREKSKAYAEKKNLPIYDYTMHPRTTGFVHCLRELRGPEGQAVDVCDVDIAFVGDIPQAEKQIIEGTFVC